MKSLFVTRTEEFVARTEELDARLDAGIDELHEIDRVTARLDAWRNRCLARMADVAEERATLVSDRAGYL